MGAENLWYVRTADGDVDRMSLDELDEAFNAGRIDENARVLAPGESTWQRLGDLLGVEPAAQPAPIAAQPLPASLRPLSLDLSDDPDALAFKKKSRKGLGVAAAVVVLLIPAAILGANRLHVGSGDPPVAAAAPSPAPEKAPDPQPAAPPPAATAAAPSPDDRLAPDMKARLLAADKAHEEEAKARKKAREAGGRWHGHHKYKSQGFTTGGSKFDPLNASM